MALNYIWAGLFLVGILVACLQLVAGQPGAFASLTESLFAAARQGFDISLGLTGAMAFWLGMLRVGQAAGLTDVLARGVAPFFQRLFPTLPPGHPAMGSMLLNFSANMLGLDNAATPLGLKAMSQLNDLNPEKGTASPAMIMFLVINTSGLTIIPTSIMALRAQAGAANPADVFLPILLCTACTTLVAVLATALVQRIPLWRNGLWWRLLLVLAVLACLVAGLLSLGAALLSTYSGEVAGLILFGIIGLFLAAGLWKRVSVYEPFIEGAKEGFQVAVGIIPYLVAMLAAVAIFRASGAMGYLMTGLEFALSSLGFDTAFAPALPVGFMKPFSGSGARGLFAEAMTTYGADSFPARVAAIMQGSTETTFYTIALYYGSVGVQRIKNTAYLGLLADAVGIVMAVVLSYAFFPA